MRLILKGVHVDLSESLKGEVAAQLHAPLSLLQPSDAAQVEVHLVDNNGPKGGMDKECRVTVRMPRARAIHITEVSDNLYKSIRLCADRLDRVFKRELERQREDVAAPTP